MLLIRRSINGFVVVDVDISEIDASNISRSVLFHLFSPEYF